MSKWLWLYVVADIGIVGHQIYREAYWWAGISAAFGALFVFLMIDSEKQDRYNQQALVEAIEERERALAQAKTEDEGPDAPVR